MGATRFGCLKNVFSPFFFPASPHKFFPFPPPPPPTGDDKCPGPGKNALPGRGVPPPFFFFFVKNPGFFFLCFANQGNFLPPLEKGWRGIFRKMAGSPFSVGEFQTPPGPAAFFFSKWGTSKPPNRGPRGQTPPLPREILAPVFFFWGYVGGPLWAPPFSNLDCGVLARKRAPGQKKMERTTNIRWGPQFPPNENDPQRKFCFRRRFFFSKKP